MTMIEKMARAELAEDPFRNNDGDEIAWEDLEPHSRNMCCRRARVALTALLEPSERQLIAIMSVFEDTNRGTDPVELSVDAYLAAIQAALDEPA